jgi:hypothetical protein
MIPYLKDPEDFTKKLELINVFGTVVRYKIST